MMRCWKNSFAKLLSHDCENTRIEKVVHPAENRMIPDRRQQSLTKLDQIGQVGLQLAALGPQLAHLAGEMEKQAGHQTQQAEAIYALMDEFTRDLNQAVSDLRTSSGQMTDALDTIQRIAQQTRIISINASIEAARAGEQGRAFGVVVDEVQRLANTTGNTAEVITGRIRDMQHSIRQVAFVADTNGGAASSEKKTDSDVNSRILDMVSSVQGQLNSAGYLNRLGEQINGHTERLILALGTFRFAAHQRAENEVAALLPFLDGHIGEKDYCEKLFERWLGEHSFFELVYITDGKGRQYVDNIAWCDGRIVHDRAGYWQDWSGRPWYLTALGHKNICSTDIYRSTATNNFCFTITSPFRDAQGKNLGVFGADVNFQRLLEL